MKELYEKAARAAYENCLALLDESKILAEHSKFARAYALCVLAAEEFCKSFLYRGVLTGLVTEEDLRKPLREHSEKIYRFSHLIATPYVYSSHIEKIKQATEHDKIEPDHAKHLFLKVMDEVSASAPERVREVKSIFSNAQQLKMKSLYVDIEGKKILVPSETIEQKEYDRIFEFLNSGLRGFEVVLTENDERFRKTAELLDPEFLHIMKAEKASGFGPTELSLTTQTLACL